MLLWPEVNSACVHQLEAESEAIFPRSNAIVDVWIGLIGRFAIYIKSTLNVIMARQLISSPHTLRSWQATPDDEWRKGSSSRPGRRKPDSCRDRSNHWGNSSLRWLRHNHNSSCLLKFHLLKINGNESQAEQGGSWRKRTGSALF